MALFPKDINFYDLFERGATKVNEGVQLLEDLVKDFINVPLKAKRIKDVEHEADLVTHETVAKLNKTFVTPLDREDIHNLICSLDNILDHVEAAADKLSLYRINEIKPDAVLLTDILSHAVQEVQKTVGQLRHMKGGNSILQHCIEINRLENEGDFVYRSAIAKLFEKGDDTTLDVLKWKEVYESIENAIDSCEDVANVIEGVALKNS
jgi:predicted phosphate transport protein (TIGR00153 family)